MVDRKWTWSRYRRKPLGREEVVHVGGKEEVGAQEWRAEPVLQEFPYMSALCRAFRAHSQRDRRPTVMFQKRKIVWRRTPNQLFIRSFRLSLPKEARDLVTGGATTCFAVKITKTIPVGVFQDSPKTKNVSSSIFHQVPAARNSIPPTC